MDEYVVPPAKQDQVVEVGGPAESPWLEMVDLKGSGATAARCLTMMDPACRNRHVGSWRRSHSGIFRVLRLDPMGCPSLVTTV